MTLGTSPANTMTVNGSATFNENVDLADKRIMNVADAVDGTDVMSKNAVMDLLYNLSIIFP